MNSLGVFQIVLYLVVLVALVRPLGAFMARVYQGERSLLSPLLAPVERLIYRCAGVDPAAQSSWKRYAAQVNATYVDCGTATVESPGAC